MAPAVGSLRNIRLTDMENCAMQYPNLPARILTAAFADSADKQEYPCPPCHPRLVPFRLRLGRVVSRRFGWFSALVSAALPEAPATAETRRTTEKRTQRGSSAMQYPNWAAVI